MPVGSILVYSSEGCGNPLAENALMIPLLLALHTSFPSAKICWAADNRSSCHLQNDLAPLVDGRIAEFINDLHIPADARLARRIRHAIVDRCFDLIIDTQRSLGRTLFLRRIPHQRFISGTWRFLFSDARPPRGLSRRPSRLSDRLLGLAAAAAGQEIPVANPIPLPPALRMLAARYLPSGPAYVAFAPGAEVKRQGECWPLERFIALARQQTERSRVPVFFIAPAEQDWYARLREAVPGALFPGHQPVGTAAAASFGPSLVTALGERVSAAVANCSGTGHLLAAGGAPMVSLYGPTRPETYAPFSRALICLKAQDFGSDRVEAIPYQTVSAALEQQIAIGPATADQPAIGAGSSPPLLAPVSVGELLDKITILEIKAERISDPTKHSNVLHELASLRAVSRRNVMTTPALEALCGELGSVNRQLWDIEDDLRRLEAEKKFDARFIELARSVYHRNDERAQIKRQINELTGSDLIEEKSYSDARYSS